MNFPKLSLHSIANLLSTAALACIGLTVGGAQAQSGASQFAIKEYQARAGTSILRDAVQSPRLPINKRFSELSADERAALLSYYGNFDVGNEPPFPIEGLKPAMELLVRMQNKLVDQGRLHILVRVDASGTASDAKVIDSPSPEMAKAAAGVMMFTKFKPALCAGVPCAMDFPLHVEFPARN